MLPRKKTNDTTPIASHFGSGDAEITSIDYNKFTGCKAWSDSDFAREILERRSVISAVHEYNGMESAWHTKNSLTHRQVQQMLKSDPYIKQQKEQYHIADYFFLLDDHIPTQPPSLKITMQQ